MLDENDWIVPNGRTVVNEEENFPIVGAKGY